MGFAKAQVEAGADIIGVGDAASSLAGPVIYSDLFLNTRRSGMTAPCNGCETRLYLGNNCKS